MNETNNQNCESCGRNCCCCGPQGPQGPQGPPGILASKYAEYQVLANFTNTDNLAFTETLDPQNIAALTVNNTAIRLLAGYSYLVSYIISGAPGQDNFIEIVPLVNSVAQAHYTGSGSNASVNPLGPASASATFLVMAPANQTTDLQLLYSSSNANSIQLIGAVTIVQLSKL